MNIIKIHPSGAWQVTDIVNGQLITRTYYGETKRGALALFKSEMKHMQEKRFKLKNPKRKSMPKRRKTRRKIRRDPLAGKPRRVSHGKRYGKGHPYFSTLPIHVQEQHGAAWKTVAAFVGTPAGVIRAKQYAHIWKRERGSIQVRVIDTR